jgi:type I restriction-modification system DNA methylase subunit
MANTKSSTVRSQSDTRISGVATPLSQRKADGVFYTPDAIVRYIVQQTLSPLIEAPSAAASTLRVLDPACGDGAFLVEVFRFLAARG